MLRRTLLKTCVLGIGGIAVSVPAAIAKASSISSKTPVSALDQASALQTLPASYTPEPEMEDNSPDNSPSEVSVSYDTSPFDRDSRFITASWIVNETSWIVNETSWIVNETLALIYKKLDYPCPVLELIPESARFVMGRAFQAEYGSRSIPKSFEYKNEERIAVQVGFDMRAVSEDFRMTREEFRNKHLVKAAEHLAEQISSFKPIACAECQVPQGVDMAARTSDRKTGFSLRYVRAYDVSQDRFLSRFDMILA